MVFTRDPRIICEQLITFFVNVGKNLADNIEPPLTFKIV